jgi:hypothetical protein
MAFIEQEIVGSPDRLIIDEIRARVGTDLLGGLYAGKRRWNFTAQGHTELFEVDGWNAIRLFAICTTALAGATATVEVGTSGDSDAIIPPTTGTEIDASDLWFDATPSGVIFELTHANFKTVVTAQNIRITVGTADLTAGQIDFYAFYEPIEPKASVKPI